MVSQKGLYVPDPLLFSDWVRVKAPLLPPEKDPEDVPYRCYKIGAEYIPALVVLVDFLTWPDAFIGTLFERQLAAKRWQELQNILIAGNLECGEAGAMEFRQSPNDDCLFEYSTDGGTTWKVAFNFALCSRAQSIVNIWQQNTETTQYVGDTMVTYAGDIYNVAPYWDVSGGYTQGEIDVGICYALHKLVDIICIQQIAAIGEGNAAERNEARLAANITFAFGEVIGDIGLYLGWPHLVLAGAILELTSQLIPIVAEFFVDSAAPYEDQEARDLVVCVAYDALQGYTPEFGAWASSLSEPMSGNGGHIRDIVYAAMQSEEFFVMYLQLMQEVVSLADLGTLPELCTDCPDFWEFLIDDFQNVPNKQSAFFVGNAGHFGTGGDLVGDDNGSGNSIRYEYVLYMPGNFHLLVMVMYYDATKVSSIDSNAYGALESVSYYDVDEPAQGTGKDIHGAGNHTGTYLVLKFDTGLSDGNVVTTGLWLRGTGENPFM